MNKKYWIEVLSYRKIEVTKIERSVALNNEIKVDAIGKENIAELLKNESQLYYTLLERITELVKNSKKWG